MTEQQQSREERQAFLNSEIRRQTMETWGRFTDKSPEDGALIVSAMFNVIAELLVTYVSKSESLRLIERFRKFVSKDWDQMITQIKSAKN